MSSYPIGNVVVLDRVLRDPANSNVLVDATTITVTILLPDGTTTVGPFTPIRDSLGTYHYNYTPPSAGRYEYRWVYTGTATGSAEGEFEVIASFGAAGLVSLTDIHQFLNIPAATTGNDLELQLFIDAATAIVENIVGDVLGTTYTEVYDGGGTTIKLRHQPVLSVTSIVEYYGTSSFTLTEQVQGGPTQYDYVLDKTIGQLWRMRAGYPGSFLGVKQNIVITYKAGLGYVPAHIRLATLDLIRVFYQRTQLGSRPQGRPADDEFGQGTMILGYLVPNFVKEALEPNQLPIGLA